jgi:hypothetical protein
MYNGYTNRYVGGQIHDQVGIWKVEKIYAAEELTNKKFRV